MTCLVITTSGGTLSVALLAGIVLLAEEHRIVGRGHAEALMPAIARVMADRGPPETILVDTGPGSFTGIRIGIAAARALGLAWGAAVHGVTATALIAAAVDPPFAGRLAVLIDAGRGRLYYQALGVDSDDSDILNLDVAAATALIEVGGAVAGPGALLLDPAAALRVLGTAAPRAAAAAQLPRDRRSGLPLPLYIGGTAPAVAA